MNHDEVHTCIHCAREFAESSLRMSNGEYYTLDELMAELRAEHGGEPPMPKVVRLDQPEKWDVRVFPVLRNILEQYDKPR